MIKFFGGLALVLSLLLVVNASAAGNDARFQIRVQQAADTQLTLQEAMTLALPTLWQRVVPVQSMKKAASLKGRTSLVLQFKQVHQGFDLVFNPVQVQSYLQQFGIQMIAEYPHWNLAIEVRDFNGSDAGLGSELKNYSYSIADELGFTLSERGRKLLLSFEQVYDVYGEAKVRANVGGTFSDFALSEVEQPIQGYLSYQLQSWVRSILREIRDAYSLGAFDFNKNNSDLYITVVANLPLAGQVSFEGFLSENPEVIQVVPVLLQKESMRYHVILRDADDAWVEAWFASYGMSAVKLVGENMNEWIIE